MIAYDYIKRTLLKNSSGKKKHDSSVLFLQLFCVWGGWLSGS